MVGEHAECQKAFPDGADQVLSFIPVKTAIELIVWADCTADQFRSKADYGSSP